MTADSCEPSFHRLIDVGALAPAGEAFVIEATPQERESIARWLNILAVDSLNAEVVIEAQADRSRATLTGRMRAQVVQACVVTLEPLTATIEAPLRRCFSAAVEDEWQQYGDEREEIFLDAEDDVEIDPLPPAGIDVGMVIAEQLALEIDPFPRAAASEGDSDALPLSDDGTARPFADLKSMLARR